MSRFSEILRRTSLRRQMAVVMAIGVFCLALLSSLAISWQGARLIRANLAEQGRQVAENLARQSKLALIYDSADNVAETVKLTLAFPDVVGLDIRRSDGKLLVGQRLPGSGEPARTEAPAPLEQRAALETESDDSWTFIAPVYSGGADSPFDAVESAKELLGYVRIIQSKGTLQRMRNDVFLLNFGISFLLAFAFLLVVHALTTRLTRPLTRLSATMAIAEAGATGIRADAAGPREIANMAQAFNKMMAVLADREQELRTARDSALQFAKLKADFAATVSHEIRTPLNGVVGTLDILKATELPAKQRQYVEIAWDSSQYLLDLINNILDFSQLEAGKVQIDSTEFGLAHTVEDVLELLAPQASQKGLDLGYLIAPDLPENLVGDPRRLRQILVNMVGNAVKFTDSGSVEVRVSRAPTGGVKEPRGLRIRFQVMDTGIGIDSNAQASIFDSFTQADTSTTRRFGGSGLGLAICKQLTTLLGGQIGVTSSLGEGSCFWFELPMTAVPAAPAIERQEWPGMRALIADDSEIARRFLQQALSGWGFTCVTADTSEAALAEYQEAQRRGEAYDLVIVDAAFVQHRHDNLPLRLRTEYGSNLHLILMNRYGIEDVPDAIHANAYLAKPLGAERLRESVNAALGRCKPLSQSSPEAPQQATAAGTFSGSRVLVVEDNRTNQAIMRGMLGMLGCEVAIAADGREGLTAFQREPWDLVLMDCAMPGMDGYEASAAIRTTEAGTDSRTPIIAMTANVQQSDIDKCLAAGMDDHLAKPLTIEQLSAKVHRWLPHFGKSPIASNDQAPMPKSEPLDYAVFGKLREILGSSIAEAIHPFLEDMPTYLEEMEHAMAAGQADQLRRAAHAIKGAAGNLGASPLAALAKEIEDHAEDNLAMAATDLLARARAEYVLVHEALLAELDGESGRQRQTGDKGALVLIVDDDRSTRTALRFAMQRNGYAVEEATDGTSALALVARMTPDVILMDAMMPQMDGFTACAKLQELPDCRDIPVLMITALDDNQSIQRAFAVGASDYIAKPLNLAVVNQRVKRVVDANRAERNMRHLALNDTLTGLPNRLMFADHLHHAIERVESAGQSLAVLFLDLDRFKFINDSLSHEIGDRLLKEVASRIKRCVRSGDCVARLGGDEFTVLLDELASPGAAANAAEKIRRSIAKPFQFNGQDIFVSASLGISLYPADGKDVSTLLRHAESAMYRAKRRGSAGYEFYEAGMEASMSEYLRLDSALRRAIERNELHVYYQPKAVTVDGQIYGMEALVRWLDPTRGIIPPLEFIPMAEETGLIIPIGEIVLRSACVQAQRWLETGIANINMAVNISGIQLQDKTFIDMLGSVLEQTGLNSRHLTLEITESVLMSHARDAVSTLRELKNLGVRIEIDDFGTGYSSLAYLRRFPVDALKIDRAFTRDMTSNSEDAAIVAGIIALAHSLRLQVVAEGVETQAQRDLLIALGCDFMQGYYLSEPLPPTLLTEQVLRSAFPHARFSEDSDD